MIDAHSFAVCRHCDHVFARERQDIAAIQRAAQAPSETVCFGPGWHCPLCGRPVLICRAEYLLCALRQADVLQLMARENDDPLAIAEEYGLEDGCVDLAKLKTIDNIGQS